MSWIRAVAIPSAVVIAAVAGWNVWLLWNKPEVIDWPAYQAILKRHEGRPIVVYLWGAYSVPDQRLLKSVAEKHLSFRKDAAFLSLCDTRFEEAGGLHEFRRLVNRDLDRANVQFPTYLLPSDPDDFLASLEGNTTAVLLVYDRQGKLVRRFDDLDWTEFDQVLTKLVGEP